MIKLHKLQVFEQRTEDKLKSDNAEKRAAVLKVVVGRSFWTLISVEMQTDPRFELKLVAVCTALENAVLLGLLISIKEQQELFVQKPEHRPENKQSHKMTGLEVGEYTAVKEWERARPRMNGVSWLHHHYQK